MNLIRLRLVEEIEAPYREHIARLEASLEAEAGAFLGLRREHELLQTEAAAHRSEHRKVVAELERHHAAEIEQADLRAAALEDRLLAAQRGDARQALEGRLRQLKVRSDALAAEVEDLRTGKAAAVSALLTENRRLQDEAANALDAARTQRSDASALSNRLQQVRALFFFFFFFFFWGGGVRLRAVIQGFSQLLSFAGWVWFGDCADVVSLCVISVPTLPFFLVSSPVSDMESLVLTPPPMRASHHHCRAH